ncbi:colicin immunity domain-containing protein [Mycobacterium sp.]|uniref:colicin immunity domain-containing protein n=1 Tax=Mycobacterium sp. TaxID=1785 RepID=UPI0025CD3C01|nr:colicin immunity domain-containing protein [Mycobacterium sp.]
MSSDGVGEAGKIDKYRDLISDFVSGRLPAHSFESQYLRVFKNDTDRAPRREFQVLENLFFAIDDYVADPELREKVGGLDDDQLRAVAQDAYTQLYEN